MSFLNKEGYLFSEEDEPPLICKYKVRYEKLGIGKKLWSVRYNEKDKRVVTAFATKKEAKGWINTNERRTRVR